jgi:transcriptional regulator with XRE-family HTH domain
MTWAEIRRHYAVRFTAAKRRGATQESIAKAGGLRGQNTISTMLANRRRGPTVETFARAVEGLGLTPSEFFLAVERSVEHVAATDPATPVSPVEAVRLELITTRFEILEQRLELVTRLEHGRTELLQRLERLETALDRLRDDPAPAPVSDANRTAHRPPHRRRTRTPR